MVNSSSAIPSDIRSNTNLAFTHHTWKYYYCDTFNRTFQRWILITCAIVYIYKLETIAFTLWVGEVYLFTLQRGCDSQIQPRLMSSSKRKFELFINCVWVLFHQRLHDVLCCVKARPPINCPWKKCSMGQSYLEATCETKRPKMQKQFVGWKKLTYWITTKQRI